MGAGNQGELAVHLPKDLMNNPITHLQTKFKELEHGFKGWLAKQSLPVEAAIVTLTSAAQGAAIGGFMGTLTGDAASTFPAAPPPGAALNQQTMASFQQAQVTVMVAAFGSGVMFSLVSGMGGPNPAANVITSGVFFALVQGGLFKVGEKFSKPPVEDVMYSETKSMLSRLGLENYEKNFKKGFALRDVRIPPGPRLVILDDIQRNKVVKGGGRRT
ncbi:hypothetical protein E3N88_21838 [Mikania micrantha]|uniref:SAM domain-containing protein n=1 Tax=Mikania micrantha TaxID=192012 RepID=A0A5N6NAA3_9ASTR|nr:hypothetical protein E3N88_21838 [Mikania micrantha]